VNCKHCPASTRSSEDVARLAGWRWFKGLSQTGKPLDDVCCPACSGADVEPAAASWSVRCDGCNWELEDDPFDDPEPLDAKGALSIAHDHECEPVMEIRAPGGEWRSVDDYNSRTGELRRDFQAVSS